MGKSQNPGSLLARRIPDRKGPIGSEKMLRYFPGRSRGDVVGPLMPCRNERTPTTNSQRPIGRNGDIDRMKRLTPDSTWWHRVPHREITRSVAQGEGGQPWTILASICTRGKVRFVSWLRAAS